MEQQIPQIPLKDTHTLKLPITFEGEHITELPYDFTELDGDVAIQAEREMSINNPTPKLFIYTSAEFQAIIFARAAKRPVEMIRKLKMPDFAEVTAITQGFLMGMGLI